MKKGKRNIIHILMVLEAFNESGFSYNMELTDMYENFYTGDSRYLSCDKAIEGRYGYIFGFR